jgi:succinate-acetate transporter protein
MRESQSEKLNELQPLKDSKRKNISLDEQIDDLLNKLNTTSLLVNRLDYYGNTIPLGAFCFGISFVIYGFSECKVFDKSDTFSFLVLLLFGGLGQITAGICEYIKSRTFPTVCYLLYGLYFISFFLGYYYKDLVLGEVKCRQIFYGTWAGLSLPVFIASLKTNVIYLLQNLSVFAFFIVRCIGECKNWNVLNEIVSGILELVTGFLSLYLCCSQVINEHFRRTILPAFPINKENEIDINTQNN